MQQNNVLAVQTDLSSVKSFGFILWWSIHKQIYPLIDLMHKGQALPQAAKNGLLGEKADGAFRKAVSLRAKQWKVVDTKDQCIYYLTNAVGEGYTLSRVTLDTSGVQIDLVQVGSIFLEGFDIKFVPTLYYGQYASEVDKLTAHFQDSFIAVFGQIDDTRIRSLLLNWLNENHRVALRPTGGVYMIPLTTQGAQRDRVHAEIVAVREWLAACGIGELSCMEVFPTVATSKQSIVKAAIDELNGELGQVEERLIAYGKSVGMNAGSRMYSSGTQVDAVKSVQNKIRVLRDAGLLELQIDLTQRRLESITTKQPTALLDRITELHTKIMADQTAILTERDAIASLYKDLQKEEKRTDADLGSNAFEVLLLDSRVDLVLQKAETMHSEAKREVDLERANKAGSTGTGFSTVTTSKPKITTSKTTTVTTGKTGTVKSRTKVKF